MTKMLVYFLNIISLLTGILLLYSDPDGHGPVGLFLILMIIISPLITLYYITPISNKDSLLFLWYESKKKKYREKLDEN